MLRSLALVFAVGLAALSISGCSTVRGFGQDVTSAANTVDEAL